MTFELYRNQRCSAPIISLNVHGLLIIPDSTIKRYDLEYKESVRLYYDKKNHCIGLKFSLYTNKESVKIRKSSCDFHIDLENFMKHYNIVLSETIRPKLSHDRKKDMFIINLT